MDNRQKPVYRFVYEASERPISPQHMWGTRDAIATLPACAILEHSERRVDPTLLDPHGFYFEQPATITLDIEVPPMLS